MVTIATIRVRTAARLRKFVPTALLTPRDGRDVASSRRAVRNRTDVLSFVLPARPEPPGRRDPATLRRAPLPLQLLVPRRGVAGRGPRRAGRRARPDRPRVTDHQGLYGVVRFAAAAEEAGLHPVIGVEIELLDAAVPDPSGIVVPGRRRPRRSRRRHGAGARSARAPSAAAPGPAAAGAGPPAGPPGGRSRRTSAGSASAQRGPHLVLLARDATGYRSLCRLVSRANLAGTKRVPRFSQALLAEHAEGLVALSGCREGEIARRLRVGDRAGARAVAERYATLFGAGRLRRPRAASSSSSRTTSCPTTTGSWRRPRALAGEARPAGRRRRTTSTTPGRRTASSHDVLTAIRHGRTLDTLGRPAPPGRRVAT